MTPPQTRPTAEEYREDNKSCSETRTFLGKRFTHYSGGIDEGMMKDGQALYKPCLRNLVYVYAH